MRMALQICPNALFLADPKVSVMTTSCDQAGFSYNYLVDELVEQGQVWSGWISLGQVNQL